jgi:uncharacterized protein YyaL (SSP411 family)
LKLTEDQINTLLEAGRKKLLDARAKRKTPYIDRNIYANWNGLAISGLVDFYRATGNSLALEMATATTRRVTGMFSQETGILHYRGNDTQVHGMLDDQINIAMAIMDLYAVTGDAEQLQTAKQIIDLTINRFWNEELKIFNDVPSGTEDVKHLGIAASPFMDTSTPSANSTAIMILDRLTRATQDEQYRMKAEEMMNRWIGYCRGRGLYCARFFLALDEHMMEPATIAVVGEKDKPGTQALLESALHTYSPSSTVMLLGDNLASERVVPSALKSALAVESGASPTAYVCLGNVCAPPTSDPNVVRETLTKGRVD